MSRKGRKETSKWPKVQAWRLKLYYILLQDDEEIIEHCEQNRFQKLQFIMNFKKDNPGTLGYDLNVM